MNKICICNFNHGKGTGIETLIKLLKDIFPKAKVSKYPKKNHTNIFFENFNTSDIGVIKKYSKLKKTYLILICTEYFNFKANTFNSFEFNKPEKVVFIYYTIEILKFLKNFFFTQDKKFLSKKIYYKNIIKQSKLSKFFLNCLDIHRYKRRFNNFLKIKKYFHFFIATHPKILEGLDNKSSILFPYKVKFKKKNKDVFFGFSGQITKYRYDFFFKLLKSIKKKDIEQDIYSFLTQLFSVNKSNFFINNYSNKNFLKKKYLYSIHLKRHKYWPYISPIRIINSLKNNEIPVITDKYETNFMKDISINITNFNLNSFKKMKNNKDKYFIRLKKNIIKFNKASNGREKKLKKMIINLNSK